MSQLVKISFKDSQNWINSEAETINWDNLSEFWKDEEVAPSYIPPIIFGDVWNGFERDVQQIRWDVFRLEFIAQSSELIELSRMQSTDTIYIHDINSNMPIQTVDMQKSEWLSFGEPERISDTSSWRLVLIYRTNKTVINKFDGLDNVVSVVGGSATYNSKYEKIPLDLPLEPIKVQWGEDGEKLLQETQKDGYQVLFYMNKTDKNALLQDWGQNDFTIDGTDVISSEKIPLEITNLGENNYKIVLSGVTIRATKDKTAAMPTVSTLDVDATPTYNSKFAKIDIQTEPEKIEVPLFLGSTGTRVLRSSRKSGYKWLFYFNEDDLASFRTAWTGTAVSRWTFDSTTAIVEQFPLEEEEMPSGLYKVIVTAIHTNASKFTDDLTPDNTHALVITDTGGPYTFHTDVPTFPNVDDTEKETITNESGLPVDSKTISRQVTDIKLYLNTADKNSLKLHYEKSSAATIDAVPILYRGIVETNELDIDLWEVDIIGLTTAPDVNYPL